jgi:hypothetical protein
MVTRKPKTQNEEVAVEKPVRKTRAKKETKPSGPLTKEQATKLKQPWVAVLDTHVSPENPANGFFELDWNEYFIVLLKSHGYDGPNEESIVDVWFQNLCKNIGNEAGINMDRRGSGYINVQSLGNNKAEIS